MEQQVILLKYGEIALKGGNRKMFEDILSKNIKWRLRDLGKVDLVRAQSTIYVSSPDDQFDFQQAKRRLMKVFGIAGISIACVVEKDMKQIEKKAASYLCDVLNNAKTFKVVAKRSDKQFPWTSPQIQQQVGAVLLEAYPHLTVDVHHPEVSVTVEIRDFGAYIHENQVVGAGGMPVGCSGKGLVLLSGGIDSPVAAYMMAKRGLLLHAIHFISPPYTSEHALEKVETLCKTVSQYAGNIRFHCIHFTKIQKTIKQYCPEELFTIIMRRMMMKISLVIGEQNGLGALITGESLAQVASQTLGAITATDQVCTMPVFRPLIGMDKQEIVQIARHIDTFETSILPYEDCCTVFTPKHPRLNPTLEQLEKAEEEIDFAPLITQAIESMTEKTIYFSKN